MIKNSFKIIMIKKFSKIILFTLGPIFSTHAMDVPPPEFNRQAFFDNFQQLPIEIQHTIFSKFNAMINYFNFSEIALTHPQQEYIKSSKKGIPRNFRPSSRTELGIMKLLNDPFFQNFPLSLILKDQRWGDLTPQILSKNLTTLLNLTGLLLGKNHIKTKHLQLLTNLKTLDVSDCSFFRLKGIKTLTNLRSLRLGSINAHCSDDDTPGMCRSLVCMQTNGKFYKSCWYPFYVYLYELTNLTRLDLNKETRIPYGGHFFNSFPERRELLKIRLRNPNLEMYYEDLLMKKHTFQPEILSSNKSVFLEDWSWGYNIPKSASLKLVSLPSLTHLILYECCLRTKYFKLLTNLIILDAGDYRNLKNEQLSLLTNLTTLHMAPVYEGITYKTLKRLTNLTNLTIVETRDGSQAYLSSEDYYYKHLRYLDPKIMRKLPARLPNLRIDTI